MMKKYDNLVYYAFRYDWNSHSMVKTNILRDDFFEKLEKHLKQRKEPVTKESIKELLDSNLKYHYWSRREYEIQVGDLWAPIEDMKKVDVYQQVAPNLDVIVDYIVYHLGIKFTKKGTLKDEEISQDK